MSAALKIFIIYAREDESFKNSLLKAFIPLANWGKIEVFHDTLIEPGDRWEDVILENLRTAYIILPLVSNDFFASEFIHEVEFKKAVDRYNKGETAIIPVILKPCSWKYDPIIKTLQVLPKDGIPVVKWDYHEDAWEQVIDAVYEITERAEEKMPKLKEERGGRIIESQKNMNAKAMRMVKSAFEANFASSYFNDYDRAMFNFFFVEMSSYLTVTESDTETERNWNADVYFLIGVNQFLSGQSKDAEKYLEKAAKRAEGFIKSRPENTDVLFPEREYYAAFGGIDDWNKMVYTKCAFYTGLNHYRLGRFRSAITEFEKSLQYAPNEIDLQFFLFQSRYWAQELGDFPKAMQEMDSLTEIVQSDTRKDEKTKKMIVARLYKKIGDFYLPSEIDDRYTAEKNLNKAIAYYEKAYNLIQEVANGDLQNVPPGHTHFVPMAYFALGKALKNGRKLKPKSPENLFEETEALCEQVILNIRNPESRYILYYMLAYAQYQLGKHREAGFNIALALVEFDRFCSNPNYYGYSPINNIMLPSQQLREELNAFKLEIFKRS